MNKKNILVTGANGFIARAFLNRLDTHQYNVYALASQAPRLPLKEGVKGFFHQDICQPFKLNLPFDFVFHLAACNFTHVGVASDDIYEQVNVQGTAHILGGVKTNQFIFMSTAKIYQQQGILITEASEVEPKGLYEQSKLKAEGLCRKILGEDKLLILRSSNVAGPGQSMKALIPVFLKSAIEGKPLRITVSALTRLQLLYINDLIDAFLSIIACPPRSGVYNIAPEESVGIEDLAKRIIVQSASRSSIECANHEEAPFSAINADKFCNGFRWQAKTSVDQLIKESYLYYVNQQV